MRNIFYLVGCLFFLSACTSTGEVPLITISSISINGEIKDVYSIIKYNSIELNEGDQLELTLLLSGNGEDLQTFTMMSDKESIDKHLKFDDSVISMEGNLTDLLKDRLRFSDGIKHTEVKVISSLLDVDDDVIFAFYLSSNNSKESAREVITLKIDD